MKEVLTPTSSHSSSATLAIIAAPAIAAAAAPAVPELREGPTGDVRDNLDERRIERQEKTKSLLMMSRSMLLVTECNNIEVYVSSQHSFMTMCIGDPSVQLLQNIYDLFKSSQNFQLRTLTTNYICKKKMKNVFIGYSM